MRADFRQCWLLTFRVQPDALARQLPPGIEPWIFDDSAWLSIVVARMDDMRPLWLPKALGASFDQVVYRAIVRCGDQRGVCFLRTEANHRLYAWGGDLLTFFHFHFQPIRFDADATGTTLSVDAQDGAALSVRFDHSGPPDEVPASLASLGHARTELCDLFHAWSVHPRIGQLGRVSVERPEWGVRMVRAMDVHAPWMTEQRFAGACEVSHAMYVADVPYRWTPWAPLTG